MSGYAGRVTGTKQTMPINPRVQMLSATANPIGTLFSVWYASRHNGLIKPKDAQAVYESHAVPGHVYDTIRNAYPEYETPAAAVLDIARQAVVANVPAGESVTMTFAVNDCSVALREQIVRSKLSSYWTQTSRTADLRTMDVNRSESIEEYGGTEAVRLYNDTVAKVRSTYEQLHHMGVPMEEVRLAPESRTHRIMWMTDLRSLRSVLNKRVDWMAQATLWAPVVRGIIQELRDYDPGLHSLFGKPSGVTIRDGTVVNHTYHQENMDRYTGRDPQPCDPLWLAWTGNRPPEHTNWVLYQQMKEYYLDLWDDETLAAVGWQRGDAMLNGPYDRP